MKRGGCFPGRVGADVPVAAAALLAATAVFVGLHLLGGGVMQELPYALTVIALLAAVGAAVSMRRLYTRRRALERALANLPEEPGALPEADTPVERQWRALATAYQRETKRRGDAFLQDAREKTDYYTLWLHQIKTPLAALQLMAQSHLPVDRELMRQELVKIEQYAGAALNFQRLQSLHEDLNQSRTALYPLCCQVARRLRPLFSYGQISLNLEPFDGTALTDSKWLGEVLTQVMTNALKYTPPGGSHHHRHAGGRGADRAGHRHRHPPGGHPSRVRPGLHRLDGPQPREEHRHRPVPVQAHLRRAWSPDQPDLRRRQGHGDHLGHEAQRFHAHVLTKWNENDFFSGKATPPNGVAFFYANRQKRCEGDCRNMTKKDFFSFFRIAGRSAAKVDFTKLVSFPERAKKVRYGRNVQRKMQFRA